VVEDFRVGQRGSKTGLHLGIKGRMDLKELHTEVFHPSNVNNVTDDPREVDVIGADNDGNRYFHGPNWILGPFWGIAMHFLKDPFCSVQGDE
jgi:hypothetical protein